MAVCNPVTYADVPIVVLTFLSRIDREQACSLICRENGKIGSHGRQRFAERPPIGSLESEQALVQSSECRMRSKWGKESYRAVLLYYSAIVVMRRFSCRMISPALRVHRAGSRRNAPTLRLAGLSDLDSSEGLTARSTLCRACCGGVDLESACKPPTSAWLRT